MFFEWKRWDWSFSSFLVQISCLKPDGSISISNSTLIQSFFPPITSYNKACTPEQIYQLSRNLDSHTYSTWLLNWIWIRRSCKRVAFQSNTLLPMTKLTITYVYISKRHSNSSKMPYPKTDAYLFTVQSGSVVFLWANTKIDRSMMKFLLKVSRSPTIVIAYIMFRYGMSYIDAFKYVQSLRPIINPNRAFCKQLKMFERELKMRTSSQGSYNDQTISEYFNPSRVNMGSISSGSKIRQSMMISPESVYYPNSRSNANLASNYSFGDLYPAANYAKHQDEFYQSYDEQASFSSIHKSYF